MSDLPRLEELHGQSVAILILGEAADQNYVLHGTLEHDAGDLYFAGNTHGRFVLPPAGRHRLKKVDAGTALAFAPAAWFTVLGIRLLPTDVTDFVPTGFMLKDVIDPDSSNLR